MNKIFKYNHLKYNIYYKIVHHNGISAIGVILKSDCPYYRVGEEYSVYGYSSTEVSEHDYNKIVVFE